MEARASASNTTTNPVKNRQRDPHVFSGISTDDADDWLKHYERVSQHNFWDDTIKLANVVFFLNATALRWFDNHETELTSWDAFKAEFGNVFGKPDCRKQQASEQLAHRFQAQTESTTSYIEDVLRLCRRVDATMSEADKLRHLFKGIAHSLFTVIARTPPTTVQEFTEECKRFEDLQSRRITHTSFDRLPEVMPSASTNGDAHASFRDVIRSEFRLFLARLMPQLPDHATTVAVQEEMHLVLNSLASATIPNTPIPPPCPAVPAVCPPLQHDTSPNLWTYPSPTPTYPTVCPIQDDRPREYREFRPTQTHPNTQFFASRRRTDVWRTHDQRPICFYCHSPGHILRYCNRRIADGAYHRASSAQDRYTDVPAATRSFENRRSFDHTSAPIRRSRSPSPYPRRLRSVSPLVTSSSHQPSN